MGSPIETWEGASAYFSFADTPAMVVTLFLIMVGLTVGTIVASSIHESHSYKKLKMD